MELVPGEHLAARVNVYHAVVVLEVEVLVHLEEAVDLGVGAGSDVASPHFKRTAGLDQHLRVAVMEAVLIGGVGMARVGTGPNDAAGANDHGAGVPYVDAITVVGVPDIAGDFQPGAVVDLEFICGHLAAGQNSHRRAALANAYIMVGIVITALQHSAVADDDIGTGHDVGPIIPGCHGTGDVGRSIVVQGDEIRIHRDSGRDVDPGGGTVDIERFISAAGGEDQVARRLECAIEYVDPLGRGQSGEFQRTVAALVYAPEVGERTAEPGDEVRIVVARERVNAALGAFEVKVVGQRDRTDARP